MSYKAGIVKAIDELKDRSGSSMIAIKKHMQANLPKDKKWMNATFLSALKSGVAAGDFVQIKNSYKLSPEFKQKRISAEKATAKKAKDKAKAAAKKATAPKKKAAPKKKTATKKAAPKKKTATKKKPVLKKKKTSTKKAAPKKKTTTKKKTASKKTTKKVAKKKTKTPTKK
eukprot:CAMPEP_0113560020 /NCGR_PEP_ID=MMETSP0015_2-20120614/19209_1 /TAXON_ID=2838 /ORGANISM="Odontella" /LENGTH=170 /DNA_ID=CAMNT_0000461699 /DNA_START=111 /DNA_END=623 /DNA_ORIENTATION=- /assembly_acc=CAM_ASM_000160